MNFWQRQKVSLAKRFLQWQYDRKQQPLPNDAELTRQAQALVDEAQRIATRTGKNFVEILKELVRDLKK